MSEPVVGVVAFIPSVVLAYGLAPLNLDAEAGTAPPSFSGPTFTSGASERDVDHHARMEEPGSGSGAEAGGSRLPPSVAESRFHTVLLAVDGFSVEQAVAALYLRAPDLSVLTKWDTRIEASSAGRVFVSLRRGPAGVRLEVVTPGGSGYLRDVPGDDVSLRGAIAAAVSLLVSIETDALRADVGVLHMPESSQSADLDALRQRVDAALDVRPEDSSTLEASPPKPVAARPPDPFSEVVVAAPAVEAAPAVRPGWALGLAAGPATQFHAGEPVFASPYDGVGLSFRATVRSRKGAAIDAGVRWLSREPTAYRIHRIRIAVAGGYELSFASWRIPVLIEAGIEPWWVTQRGGSRITPADLGVPASTAMLFSGAAVVRPGYEFKVLGSSVHAIRLGLSAHVGGAFALDDGLVAVGVHADKRGDSEIARLGGLEMGAGIETTFFFGRAR